MSVASLIGFAVALLIISWIGSVVAFCILGLMMRAIVKRGPVFERAMLSLALLSGPGFAGAVLVALLGQSFVHVLWNLPDHCLTHAHHLHLCLAHGHAWGDQVWAIAIILGAVVVLMALLVRSIRLLGKARNTIRILMQNTMDPSAVPPAAIDKVRCPVQLIDSDMTFCFVIGMWKPRLFISSKVWNALDGNERKALVVHESTHIAQRDLLWRGALRYVVPFCVPFLAQKLLARWSHATEKICDLRAAEQVDKPTVAQALVKIARLVGDRPLVCGISFAARANVADRVESVLEDQPAGVSERFRHKVRVLATVVVLSLFVFAEFVHHAVETILGIF